MPRTITLQPINVRLDCPWNSRQDYELSTGTALEPADALTDEQLEESIRTHGFLQPPAVFLHQGQWFAAYGLRRIRIAQKIDPEGEFTFLCYDELSVTEARVLNLSENLHRRALKPWEIAESLHELKKENPHLKNREIAEQTNLSISYVGNLIRLRSKAHPEIWEQFKRWGTSLQISYQQLLKIVSLPRDEQLKAWRECVEGLTDSHGKRGKQKRPGPVKLVKYLNAVDNVSGKSKDFKRGLKFGLQVALGKKKFPATKL